MLGMVFTELVELVEEKFSPELADEIITEAGFSHGGAYTAVGYYDHEEIVKLVTLLSAKTGIPAGELITAFGKHLFESFTRTHARILADKHSIIDLLATLDNDIHVEVRKLYGEATLPTFAVLERSEHHIEVEYRSERQLEALVVGLIEGAADHFGHEKLSLSQQPIEPGVTRFKVEIA
jgi:hypothetical protein